MKVIDNFLDQESYKALYNDLYLNKHIPYYIGYPVATTTSDDGMFFIHEFYQDDRVVSDYFDRIKSLLFNKLDYITLLRAKLNLYPKTDKVIQHEFHKDYLFVHKNAIYYLNSNNGYTMLENGTKVNSVANRLLLLEDNEVHASSTCSDSVARYTININYF
jgi:hypothetical protein